MPELDVKLAWQILEEVKDPEIPVVSVVEMGIIRKIEVHPGGKTVEVTMTPTFSGCPAFHVMQEDIEQRLVQAGAEQVKITVSHAPPWTTDWISEEAREKLKDFGLAPPPCHGGAFEASLLNVVRCPYCDSENTQLKNSFGPTLCRAIFYCDACKQPFEQFKPI
jgi:ring-1,2-phenylacetyl-CoA epoxidase subunit PaaD